MYFSEEALRQLHVAYLEAKTKGEDLKEAYVKRNYMDSRAREYAVHGFSRRLDILIRCLTNTFRMVPPERIQRPKSDERTDALINIQAFVFNAFASTDNLAWIWVSEKNVRLPTGKAIPKKRIGLGKKNAEVRASFHEEFRNYLQKLDAWFDHLTNFRDALAHRIPLYIPPYVVPDEVRAQYDGLAFQMQTTSAPQDYERLAANQNDLVEFRPWVTHSFEENAKVVEFHPQLLADFNTIDELGRKILEELDRPND